MIGSILAGKKPIVAVPRDTTIAGIAELLHRHRIGAVLVIEDGIILGLVSERDICAGLHTRGAAILVATAGDIMSTPVITAGPGESVARAMTIMTERRFRHLPVVLDDRVLGVISIGDLVKARLEAAEAEAAAMKEYIAG